MASRSRINSVTYNAWRAGSTFAKGVNTSRDVSQDAYQSTNMQVYSNGTLGVRPWMRKWPDAGYPNTTGLGTDFRGMHWHPPYLNDNTSLIPGCLVLNNTASTRYSSRYFLYPGYSGDRWVNTTFPVAFASHPQPYKGNNSGYTLTKAGGDSAVLSPGIVIYDGFATYSGLLDNYAAISWSTPSGFNPRYSAEYKERVYYWGDTSSPTMIVYSDASAPTTVSSSTQFFKTGSSDATGAVGVIAAFGLRDSLMLFDSTGEWFALSGASPVTGTLRSIGRAATPAYLPGGVAFRNAVWFLSRFANDSGVSVASPQGVDSVSLDYIRPANDYGWDDVGVEPLRALASHEMDALMLPYLRHASSNGADGFQSIDMINNSWSHSSYWNTSLDTGGRGGGSSGDVEFADVAMVDQKYMFVLTDEENTTNVGSDYVQLYSRDIVLDRPSKGNDLYSDSVESIGYAGGSVTTGAGHVKLAAFTPPSNNQSRVLSVTVDFDFWADDDTQYAVPGFTVSAITAGVGAPGTSATAETQTFSGSGLTATQEFATVTYNFGDTPFGAQSLVELTGIQGVAFHRVTVEYEIRPNTPRS